MDPVGKETADFLRNCETLHALLATGLLAPKDQSVIEVSCNDLLSKMRSQLLFHQGQRGLPY
jgi:hypothetical protein